MKYIEIPWNLAKRHGPNVASKILPRLTLKFPNWSTCDVSTGIFTDGVWGGQWQVNVLLSLRPMPDMPNVFVGESLMKVSKKAWVYIYNYIYILYKCMCTLDKKCIHYMTI